MLIWIVSFYKTCGDGEKENPLFTLATFRLNHLYELNHQKVMKAVKLILWAIGYCLICNYMHNLETILR